MGTANVVQDWRNDYEIVSKAQFDPTKITLKHKIDQHRYELITLFLSDNKDADKLIDRLKKRQAKKSRYLVPIEKIYHRQDNNLCGNNLRYDLIIPQTQSTLQQHFNYRKIKLQPFSAEQVMYVIQNSCLALRDLQSMEDQHGNVTFNSLIINNELLLEDPIVSATKTYESQAYLTKNIVGFPSPAILFNQYDSGIRIDKFKQDLFSVGIISLHLLNPQLNLKAIYQTKNRKYQNPRVNFDMLANLVNSIHYHPLREWVAVLVHQSSEERLKIYPMIERVRIDRNSVNLLRENPRMITPEQQLAQTQQPPPLPQQLKAAQSIQQASYPRPELAFTTNPSHTSHTMMNSVSSSTLNQNTGSIYNKVSFRTTPSVQSIESQLTPLKFEPEYTGMHYSTPTFNKEVIMSKSSGEKGMQWNSTVIPSSLGSQAQYSLNKNNLTVQLSDLGQGRPRAYVEPIQSHSNSIQGVNHQSEHQRMFRLQNKNSQHYLNNYYQQIPNYRQANVTQSARADLLTQKEGLQISSSLPSQRPSSRKNELKQQLSQLEELTRQNQQLQRKLNMNTAAMFQASLLPLPHEQIIQVTEEDSKIEESSFVIENYEDGTRYEGFVKDHARNGYGKFYYKSGSVYDGEWKNNLMNGYGTLYYPEGKIAYQGYWEHDEFNGKGVIYNDNPQIIRGNFDYTDFGKLDPDQWQTYEGECKDSKKHGKGKLTLSNMETYEGEFQMDLPHGSGVFTQLRGQKIKGVWSDGLLRTIVD